MEGGGVLKLMVDNGGFLLKLYSIVQLKLVFGVLETRLELFKFGHRSKILTKRFFKMISKIVLINRFEKSFWLTFIN